MKHESKITPSDLRRQAGAMVANGTMPSLEDVLKAVASTREEFVPKIREARRQAKIHVVKPETMALFAETERN
jgi:hypothetical protein